MSNKPSLYSKPFSIYGIGLFYGNFCKKWLFQPFLLGLYIQYVWNTNRKVSILVKMSYKPSLYNKPFSRYSHWAIFINFFKKKAYKNVSPLIQKMTPLSKPSNQSKISKNVIKPTGSRNSYGTFDFDPTIRFLDASICVDKPF